MYYGDSEKRKELWVEIILGSVYLVFSIGRYLIMKFTDLFPERSFNFFKLPIMDIDDIEYFDFPE